MPKQMRFLGWVVVAAFCMNGWADAQQAASSDRLGWWRDARFGMFIHWGPVSLKGTEIGWSRGGERRGTGGAPGAIPVEIYDTLYKEFNPVEFNAREWVEIAKNAGMKYLVFTTRHHDGFSMFDTAQSDYKITNTPFKRDVVAELAQACHEAGLRLGFYYSPPDWHHPDYRTGNHARFIEYLHNQARELCTKYGTLDIFWFDGLGGTVKDWDSERLIKMIRELQPAIIVNDRAGLPEDYSTPEQQVGHFERNRPWETCMTIGDQWAWKPKDNVKTSRQCIQVLVKCAGGDGNLLFNVGPMPDGRIEGRQVARLMEMGAWLKQFGETIYGTRGGPFRPESWGVSTCRANRVYVHVLNWNGAGEKLLLPPLPVKVKSCALLTGGEATCKQSRKNIAIAVPDTARVAPDTIIVLELDGDATALEPAGPLAAQAVTGKKASASNVYENNEGFFPDMAFDGNDGTRWATDGGTHEAWLAIRLDKPTKIGEVRIKEAYPGRIESFELQYKQDNLWKTFHEGTTIGEDFRAVFKPVKAREFRLNIRKANEGPTLWEFRLLPPAVEK